MKLVLLLTYMKLVFFTIYISSNKTYSFRLQQSINEK